LSSSLAHLAATLTANIAYTLSHRQLRATNRTCRRRL